MIVGSGKEIQSSFPIRGSWLHPLSMRSASLFQWQKSITEEHALEVAVKINPVKMGIAIAY